MGLATIVRHVEKVCGTGYGSSALNKVVCPEPYMSQSGALGCLHLFRARLPLSSTSLFVTGKRRLSYYAQKGIGRLTAGS